MVPRHDLLRVLTPFLPEWPLSCARHFLRGTTVTALMYSLAYDGLTVFLFKEYSTVIALMYFLTHDSIFPGGLGSL